MPPTVAQVYLTTRCGLACEWCPAIPLRRCYGGRGVDAKWDPTKRNIEEIADMGIPRVKLDGGDVLLMPWLPRPLELCNELGLHCSITLSGQMLRQRLSEWGDEWLGLPDVLGLSVEGNPQRHDKRRAKGCHPALVATLKASARVRRGKPTLLVFTLVPGIDGNIDEVQIESVLELAREHGAIIMANFLFGPFHTGRKDECRAMWTSLAGQELEVLDWLKGQPEVLPFDDKLAFIRGGGNNIENTSCHASEAVLVISPEGKVVRHCFISPHASVKIEEGGIRAAVKVLDELYREEHAQRSGTITNYCQGCMALCHIGVGWAHKRGLVGPELTDELMRF